MIDHDETPGNAIASSGEEEEESQQVPTKKHRQI